MVWLERVIGHNMKRYIVMSIHETDGYASLHGIGFKTYKEAEEFIEELKKDDDEWGEYNHYIEEVEV